MPESRFTRLAHCLHASAKVRGTLLGGPAVAPCRRATREPRRGPEVGGERTTRIKEAGMIKWAIIFFIISVVAGFFGFTGVA
ncbi:MAG TPA: DUF1328 domain-containing protein, partial [Casimicrobiaceae bacterium]|nr:DUF1328 domain-containing protein [Casimicrobiaceae bacterium]